MMNESEFSCKPERAMSKRLRTAVLVSGIALFGLAIKLIGHVEPFYPKEWAFVPFQDRAQSLLTDEQKIECELGEDCSVRGVPFRTTPAELLKENPIQVATFHTVDGNDIRISVMFLRFTDTEIEPTDGWKRLVSSLHPRQQTLSQTLSSFVIKHESNQPQRPAVMVINSVDKDESRNVQNSRSLAFWLNKACGPFEKYAGPLSLGAISVHECMGTDLRQSNVAWVSNNAAVIWGDAHDSEAPCWIVQQRGLKTGSADSDLAYQKCLQEAAGSTVKQLFSYLLERADVQPDALVVSAVGTGQTGGLSKPRWYSEVASQIFNSIQDPKHAANLPSSICLAVYLPEDDEHAGTMPSDWATERTAIASSVGQMVRDWTLKDHEVPKGIEATALLIPALFGLAGVSFFVAIGFPKLPVTASVPVALTKTFLETVGTMSIYVAIFGGLGETRPLALDLATASLLLLVIAIFFLRQNCKD
jgi:hypothetical protein